MICFTAFYVARTSSKSCCFDKSLLFFILFQIFIIFSFFMNTVAPLASFLMSYSFVVSPLSAYFLSFWELFWKGLDDVCPLMMSTMKHCIGRLHCCFWDRGAKKNLISWLSWTVTMFTQKSLNISTEHPPQASVVSMYTYCIHILNVYRNIRKIIVEIRNYYYGKINPVII